MASDLVVTFGQKRTMEREQISLIPWRGAAVSLIQLLPNDLDTRELKTVLIVSGE